MGAHSSNLAGAEIKAFVSARALGFEVPWINENMAYVRQFYVKARAKNFMMHMLVENVDDWYQHVVDSGLAARFGVLWRIGQDI